MNGNLSKIIYIGFGGFIGSVARFFVSRLNLNVDLWGIPLGTLTVNVVGSFLIGFLTGISEKSILLNAEWRMFLMVGLCGGFTTFSTFSNENLMLLHNGQFFTVMLYTSISVILGFLAVYLGYGSSNVL